ncbi:MAG: radical SAM protein [Elusimicrobia bacterium]|nr:radical SAM protein [Elusimicrobiota bacterium]
MKRVALIQAPVWGTREPPLGVVQLAGCLKSRGIPVKSFDFNNYLYQNRSKNFDTSWAWEQSYSWYDSEWVENFFKDYYSVAAEFVDEIMEFSPEILGFSVSASTFYASLRLAEILKNLKEDLIIVFGGPSFIDKDPVEEAFSRSPVDYIITGDGDAVFPLFVEAIEYDRDIKEISGLYYRDEKGEISHTGGYPIYEDLDKLPYMDFTDLRIEDYDDKVHLALMSARGCVWNCSFCSTRAFDKGYRTMSAERMHQEISWHRINHYDRHRKDNLGHVDFMDLELNGRISRVVEFCELMIKYPPCEFLPKMRWVSNAIIHPGLTKEVLNLMARAGCKKPIFGIESGSQKVLNLMRKNYDVDTAIRVIREASQEGIEVTLNFMFGFPGETEEDFLETLDFIKTVGPYIERAYPSRTYCAVEQHSYLHANLEEFNVKTPVNHHLYWETVDGTNNYPIRLERCARFENFCIENNIRVDRGVETTVAMDNYYNLGFYYDYKKDYSRATEYFLMYLNEDPENDTILSRFREIIQLALPGLSDDLRQEAEKYKLE